VRTYTRDGLKDNPFDSRHCDTDIKRRKGDTWHLRTLPRGLYFTKSMLDVLKTTKIIVDRSRYINISHNKIVSLCRNITPQDLQISEINLARYSWSPEELIQIVFIFNVMNFCFWAKKEEKKWTIKVEGKQMDGSVALFRVIEEEIKSNPNFLKGNYLAKLSSSKLKAILKGNVVIPLFSERLKCLQEAGRVLENKFNNSFLGLFEKAKGDAVKMADLLINNFPHFNDVAKINGIEVAFYKRAQLNSKMVNDVLVSRGQERLKNLDKLTAFADYKIPQILRKMEILEYNEKLARQISDFTIIENNSRQEIEIRANTIWGVEFIRQELKKKFSFVTASHIDSMLWNLSQKKSKNDKPYHRTLTINY